MLGCKPAKSPLRSKTVMSLRKEGEEKADQARYLAAVGSCMPCLVLDLISHTLLVYSVDLRAIHLAHTGTVSSPSLSICIILPSSDARKLNKCFHCTLSKQKCSMTVR